MAKLKKAVNKNFLLFAKRLRELRESLNLTQAEFAERTGFTQATLSAYENSLKVPSLDIVMGIATECKVSIDWLCGLSESKMLNGNVNTYSDLLRIVVSLDEALGIGVSSINLQEAYFDGYINCSDYTSDVCPCIYFTDDMFGKLLHDWDKIKQLHTNKTIDDDLYKMWIDRKCDEYGQMLFYNSTIKEEEQLNNE